ncbi:MAG: peptidase M16 [Paenibacillaceae bacterium]|nr:MAG: peptidase M16 [Paenibacillaceae bacterium]
MTGPWFEQGQSGRIRLHVMPTKRFKTYQFTLYAGVPLSDADVTRTALLPFVLRRGTAATPETRAFRERLDDLYGAGFGFDVMKRGDSHVIVFQLEVLQDRFARGAGESLLAAGMRLLGEVVTQPALENGAFLPNYVDTEKTTVRKRLEAIVNDKIRYAAERCIEEMCAGEAYRLNALGKIEDLPRLTPETLHAYYAEWLKRASFDLYVTGDTTLDEASALAAESFRLPDGAPGTYPKPADCGSAGEVKTVVERMDVTQGKLNMGLRIGVRYADDDYPAALMYNGILGAFPHSKLFINVRERASLAYYAASRYDGHKGILTIQSGIEIANFERASAIIREQLDAIARGDISELELSQTRAMITGQLRELRDSAPEMIAFHFNGVLSGRSRDADELIRQIEAVTRDDIVRVAERVKLDTIYFLRDGKEE